MNNDEDEFDRGMLCGLVAGIIIGMFLTLAVLSFTW